MENFAPQVTQMLPALGAELPKIPVPAALDEGPTAPKGFNAMQHPLPGGLAAPAPPPGGPIFLNPTAAAASYPAGQTPGEIVPFFDAELDAANEPPMPVRLAAPPGAPVAPPSPAYKTRWAEIARLHAMGHTNNQIAAQLGYSVPALSVALAKPWVQAEVERLRARYYNQDAAALIKESALDGARVIHSVINDSNAKMQLRVDTSKWAIEKATGKPKQEIAVESATLGTFMELVKNMRDAGEVIDITPDASAGSEGEARATRRETLQPIAIAAPKQSKFDDWIDENFG